MRGLAEELAARGHRVLVIAAVALERARARRRARRSAPRATARELLLGRRTGAPRVLGVGEVLPFAAGAAPRASLPIDVARTIEEALAIAPLDVVHVHEPFAPSASSAALRHSRALNVGTFHAPTERVLSTQVARRFVELFFGRLDARMAQLRGDARPAARASSRPTTA